MNVFLKKSAFMVVLKFNLSSAQTSACLHQTFDGKHLCLRCKERDMSNVKFGLFAEMTDDRKDEKIA